MKKVHAFQMYGVNDKKEQEELKCMIEAVDIMWDKDINNGRILQKFLGNITRASIDSENVVGFAFNNKNGDIIILEFPIKATDDNHFKVGKDENGFYIEVEEEE